MTWGGWAIPTPARDLVCARCRGVVGVTTAPATTPYTCWPCLAVTDPVAAAEYRAMLEQARRAEAAR